MRIKTLLMAMLMALPMLLASCGGDADPESAEWFDGKKFTALCTDENHDYLYYVMEFKYKPDGKTNDGTFTITPYSLEGKKLGDFRTYRGVWSVDFNNSRLSIVYDGYSTNYRWTFEDYDGDFWPNYKPNRNLFGPNGSSGDPFQNFIFHAGETWKSPEN